MAKGKSRDRTKESYWRRMVRKQASSGLKVRPWCRQQGVQEHTFHVWRRELRRRDAEETPPTFVPVHVTDAAASRGEGRVEIILVDGQRVRIRGRVDRQSLADVLAVLESVGGNPSAFGSVLDPEARTRRAAQTGREVAAC